MSFSQITPIATALLNPLRWTFTVATHATRIRSQCVYYLADRKGLLCPNISSFLGFTLC